MFLKRYFLIGITIIFLSTDNCHSFIFNTKGKIQSPDYITNYLYGSVLYNQKQHNLAAKYFERTNKLQEQHFNFDVKQLNTHLINGDIDRAANLVLETGDLYNSVFIFRFAKIIHFLKEENYSKASLELNEMGQQDALFEELKRALNFWIKLEENKTIKNYNENAIRSFKSRYISINTINQFLASKYVGNKRLYEKYNSKILKSENLVRYQILSAWNELRNDNDNQALSILKSSIKGNSNNLLLKQSYVNLLSKKQNIYNFFDPTQINDNLSEIFYLFSNLYQQRNDFAFSQILLSVSLNFNEKFISNKLIAFENKLIENPDYQFNNYFLNELRNIGSEYNWFINYQLLVHDQIKEISILEGRIKDTDIFLKNKYLDLANYLRSKKKYSEAIRYYDLVEKVDKNLNWTFYYFKGIAYERMGDWKNSEIYLQKAITLSPRQYSVINYLAYSWLEREEKIDQATTMLEEAVKLSQWKLGYIIDSLGWGYFLKGDFDKAEKLLKIAYEKTPSEAEVYDHYGDVLWKQKKFLQARYVWKNALVLNSIDEERKTSLNNKLVNGLIGSD